MRHAHCESSAVCPDVLSWFYLSRQKTWIEQHHACFLYSIRLTMLSTHQWWDLKKEAEKIGLDEKPYATWVKILGYLVVFKDKRRFGILVVGLVHDATVRALRWCLGMLNSSASIDADAGAKHTERFTQKFVEEVTTLLCTVGCTDADCKLWSDRMQGAWSYIEQTWKADEDEEEDDDDQDTDMDESNPDHSNTDTDTDTDTDSEDDDDNDESAQDAFAASSNVMAESNENLTAEVLSIVKPSWFREPEDPDMGYVDILADGAMAQYVHENEKAMNRWMVYALDNPSLMDLLLQNCGDGPAMVINCDYPYLIMGAYCLHL